MLFPTPAGGSSHGRRPRVTALVTAAASRSAGGAGRGGAARALAHPGRSWAAKRGIRGEQPVWWRPAQRPKVPLVVALAPGNALAWPV